MKSRVLFTFLLLASFVYISSFRERDENNNVPYPEGYRDWTHVKSAIIGPRNPAFKRFGGIHHIYANQKAMKGYESGEFPNGAILVFDVLEMNEQENGTQVEGSRKFIDVMVKDKSKYDSTGGWGFEEFNENSMSIRNIGGLAKVQCFNCHAKQANKDFVFSEYRK